MAPSNQVSRPEHMLPIMIVLGIMFIGICIAMNLFSRARFKKRSNVFTAAGATRVTTNRRSHRGGPGGSVQRLGSCCPSPMPQQPQQDMLNGNMIGGGGGGGSIYKQSPQMYNSQSAVVDESGRTSVMRA